MPAEPVVRGTAAPGGLVRMHRISRFPTPAFLSGRTLLRAVPVALLALAMASCGPKAPPPPQPPPPPPKVVVPPPPKPVPPMGASDNLAIPSVDASGLRQSVNRGITPAQTLWNLRSAFNVAALNCNSPAHAAILPRYKAFLKANGKVLSATNKKVDAEFKARYGAKFSAPREEYMTSVYNHFALPPVTPAFCNAVLAMSADALTVKPAGLEAFAGSGLPSIEVVYDDFYRRYETYRAELAEWQARYDPPAPAPKAGTP